MYIVTFVFKCNKLHIHTYIYFYYKKSILVIGT